MDNEEFDKIMSEPYSKEGWAVMPLKKPPIDKDLNDFLEKARQSFIQNPGTPLCIRCFHEFEIKEDCIICPICGNTVYLSPEEE